MNEPIVEVIEPAHGEFVQDRVTVRTGLGDSLPPVQGDRVQLQQVMLNLVVNAIQAMSDVRDSKRELHVATGVVVAQIGGYRMFALPGRRRQCERQFCPE